MTNDEWKMTNKPGVNWTLPKSRDTLGELFKFSGYRSLAEFTAVEEDHLSKCR